jgi:magnesium transporter
MSFARVPAGLSGLFRSGKMILEHKSAGEDLARLAQAEFPGQRRILRTGESAALMPELCYKFVTMMQTTDHLQEPVMTVARKDAATLEQGLTVHEALEAIRGRELGEKIVYFYTVDKEGRLAGVVPTRRLREIMVPRVVAIPQTATLLEACEAFVMHKFLAFPVVDEQRRIVGVVDVSFFTEEVFDIAGRQEELFEAIGFHVAQVREASPLRAFRFRFPWLLATIGSGTVCALLAAAFELTLAMSLVLAFFLTLVLGLAESVSVQSMTVTIQALRAMAPTRQWYMRAFRREAGTALLLGVACGTVVGLIVWLWRGNALAALSIGTSLLLALCTACWFGLSIPAALHALKLDPKIAAGPVTLACTDVFTLFFYLAVAAWLL